MVSDMVEFYSSEKINKSITAIRSMTGEIMYLIEGENKAALIDTCLGVGHLKAFVEQLTNKPITVILTHGHIDHAMGAPEFDEVYMNLKDEPVYAAMSGIEERKGYIAANLLGELTDFNEEDYVKPYPINFLNLQDGDSFDLGGIHLDIYSLPGHTKGTMVILIREEGVLILGDGCNTATFLFDENPLTVEMYRSNLIALEQRLRGKYHRVFLCHHDMEVSIDIMKNVIEVCDMIMEGNTDDIPFTFMGHTYFIAKAVGEHFRRLDGMEGNIIYHKDKVKE